MMRRGPWAGIAAVAAVVVVLGCEAEEPVTRPEPISLDSPFQYPIELWDQRIEGETVVMVHVTDMGGVDSAYVHQTSGQEAFDSAAVHGARQLRFSPGRRGDRRVDSWARLPVRFRLPQDTAAVGEGS